MLFILMNSVWLPMSVTQIDFGKGGKIQAPAYSVSGKGPSLRLNDFSSVLRFLNGGVLRNLNISQVRWGVVLCVACTEASLDLYGKI